MVRAIVQSVLLPGDGIAKIDYPDMQKDSARATEFRQRAIWDAFTKAGVKPPRREALSRIRVWPICALRSLAQPSICFRCSDGKMNASSSRRCGWSPDCASGSPRRRRCREMDASAYAFAHGVRHTRATLRAWQARPEPVIGRWFAGAALAAVGLLIGVWVVASLDRGYEQVLTLQPPFAVGDGSDVLGILRSNLLVLALHAMACVAGFIAGSSLPLQAEQQHGLQRWVHERGGRLAIGFVVAATAFSLSVQAYAIGHTLAGVSHFLRISPGVLLLGVLPHAVPELIALFLPLAAWIIASRRGEWEQLLAATFVTVAIALPVLVAASAVEVYVSPHFFTSLTHIHPPITRSSEGEIVTVR